MPALPAYRGPGNAAPQHAGGEYGAGSRPLSGQAVNPEDIVAGGGSPMWNVVSSPGLPGQPHAHVSRPDAVVHSPTTAQELLEPGQE